MDVKQFEMVVSTGSRRWYERLLAMAFFFCALYMISIECFMLYKHDFAEAVCYDAVKSLQSIAFCVAGGVAFMMTKTILIDVDRSKLISRYEVGQFRRDRVSTVPELDYVAVFKNAKGEFEVNLWYARNKHYKMFVFDAKQPAMDFAAIAARKLNIDLLDATEKGNFTWIEQTKS